MPPYDRNTPPPHPDLPQLLTLLTQYGGPNNYDPRMQTPPGMGFDPETYYNTVSRPQLPIRNTAQDMANNAPLGPFSFHQDQGALIQKMLGYLGRKG